MSNRSSLWIFAAVVFLFLCAPAPPVFCQEAPSAGFSADSAEQDAEYALEKAEFSYYSENYLDASILCKDILKKTPPPSVRARAELIKWLSDLKLSYVKTPDEPLSEETFRDKTGIMDIFSGLYESGSYGVMDTLAQQSGDEKAKYFRSLSLYKTGRHAEAALLLTGIAPDSFLYPYARVMLAQLSLIKNDAAASLSYLSEAEKSTKGGLKDRIALYSGYLLFEKENYRNAAVKFLDAGKNPTLRREALTAAVWANLKAENFKAALSLLGELKPLPLYDWNAQELLLVEAYLYLKTGRPKEAKRLAIEAANLMTTLETGYKKLSEKDAIPKENIIAAVSNTGGRVFKDGGDIAMKSVLYAAQKKDSPALTRVRNHYDGIRRMKSLYERKILEVESTATDLKNAAQARKEGLQEIKERTEIIKELLKKLEKKVMIRNNGTIEIRKSEETLDAQDAITRRWEKLLNRRLTVFEKNVVEMVSVDGESGIWYMNNTAYSQFLYWMAIDTSKDRGGGVGKGLLEMLVKDTYSTASGEAIPFETMLPGLAEAVKKRAEYDALILLELKELEKKIAAEKTLTEKAAEKTLDYAAAIIKRRAAMMRFEIRTLGEKTLDLLGEIEKEG